MADDEIAICREVAPLIEGLFPIEQERGWRDTARVRVSVASPYSTPDCVIECREGHELGSCSLVRRPRPDAPPCCRKAWEMLLAPAADPLILAPLNHLALRVTAISPWRGIVQAVQAAGTAAVLERYGGRQAAAERARKALLALRQRQERPRLSFPLWQLSVDKDWRSIDLVAGGYRMSVTLLTYWDDRPVLYGSPVHSLDLPLLAFLGLLERAGWPQ